MAEPKSLASLKAYYNVPIHAMDVKEVLKTLADESDRTAIVVWGSMLDDALVQMLKRNMREMDPKDEDRLRLFNGDGPLGAFSVRINVAYALDIIDEHTRADLQDFRAMRNACAHSFRRIDLATPELAAVCLRLFKPERETAILLKDEPTQENLRLALSWKAALLLMTIVLGTRYAAQKMLIQLQLASTPEGLDDQQPEPSPDK